MKPLSFGDAEYPGKRKQTRREVFLAEMDQVVPGKTLRALIDPSDPVAGCGRHPYLLATMLRAHRMENGFGLSDPTMEEALYEIASMRQLAGLTLDRILNDTTMLNFRPWLKAHDLAPAISRCVTAHLTRKGLLLKRGNIADTTIIAAPSSATNAARKRAPEMYRTKRGKQGVLPACSRQAA